MLARPLRPANRQCIVESTRIVDAAEVAAGSLRRVPLSSSRLVLFDHSPHYGVVLTLIRPPPDTAAWNFTIELVSPYD